MKEYLNRVRHQLSKGVSMGYLLFALLTAAALFVVASQRIDQLTPIGQIKGSYRGIVGTQLYQAQCSGESIQIEREGVVVLSATYTRAEDNGNTYILTDEEDGSRSLLTLDHEGFFFLEEETDQLVYLQKVSTPDAKLSA